MSGAVECPCGQTLAVQVNLEKVEVRHRKRSARFVGEGEVTIICDKCSRETIIRVGKTAPTVV